MSAILELKNFLKSKGLSVKDLKTVKALIDRTRIGAKNKEIKHIHDMKNDEDRSKYLVTQRNKQFTIKHKKFMTESNRKLNESKQLRETANEKVNKLNDDLDHNNSYQYTIILFINADDETEKLVNESGVKIVAPRNCKKKDATLRKQRFIKHNGILYKQVGIVKGTYSNKVDHNNYLKYLSYQSEPKQFKSISKYINLDSNVKESFMKIEMSKFITMTYVYNEMILKGVINNKQEAERHLNKRIFKKLFDDINLGDGKLMNPYIKYELNKEGATFGDLFYGDYVELDNKKANSCYINLILDTYYNQFEKKKTTGQRYYKNELSYELLCNIMKIQNLNADLGLSIVDSVAFFKKYKLGLDVLDIFGNLVYRFRPEGELNQNLSPHILRVVIYNNHVYKANKDIRKIEHIDIDDDTVDDIKSIQLSNKYYIRDTTKVDDTLTVFVQSFEDITLHIKTTKAENDRTRFVFSNIMSLNDILYEMVKKHKVIPNVTVAGNRVLGLCFNIGDDRSYSICQATDDTNPEDTTHYLSEDEYLEYVEADNVFYSKIVQKHLLSEYPEHVLNVDNYYPMAPSSGYLTKKFEDEYILNAIDMNKAYTSCLQNITQIPIFGYFDVYEPYIENDPINPYYMYVVEHIITKSTFHISHTLIFDKLHDRVYGMVLLDAQNKKIQFQIKYVRKYSKLETVDFDTPIKELYEMVTPQCAKYCVNKTTGLLEKKNNKRTITKIFTSYAEAQSYQLHYSIKDSKIVCISSLRDEAPLNFENTSDVDQTTYIPKSEYAHNEQYIYMLQLNATEPLKNGCRQIKELIYCMMKIKLHNLYLQCKAEGLRI